MLRVLTGRCDSSGRVKLGVRLIAGQAGLGTSQTSEWLGALSARGLLVTRRRGAGAVAVRQLVADPVTRQLSLFDDGRDAAPAPPSQPSADRSPASLRCPASRNQMSGQPDVTDRSPASFRCPASRNQMSGQPDVAVKNRARELLPPLPPASGGSTSSPGLADDFAPVRRRAGGDRRRDRDAFDRQMQAWASVHFPNSVSPGAVSAAVTWLEARSSGPVTAGDVRRFAAANPVWASQLGVRAATRASGAPSCLARLGAEDLVGAEAAREPRPVVESQPAAGSADSPSAPAPAKTSPPAGTPASPAETLAFDRGAGPLRSGPAAS